MSHTKSPFSPNHTGTPPVAGRPCVTSSPRVLSPHRQIATATASPKHTGQSPALSHTHISERDGSGNKSPLTHPGPGQSTHSLPVPEKREKKKRGKKEGTFCLSPRCFRTLAQTLHLIGSPVNQRYRRVLQRHIFL